MSDATLTQRFGTWGDTSGGWVGADSTYSVALGGGQTAWLFSDTLWGSVQDHRLNRAGSLFLHNSVVLDDGMHLRALQADPGNPREVVPNDGDAFHWLGAGVANDDGTLSIATLKLRTTGEKLAEWTWLGNELAVVDPSSDETRSLAPLPSGAGIQWASWLQRESSFTYVFGVEEAGQHTYAHVARTEGSLADASTWRYWDGSGWSGDERTSARIADDVSNEFSVTPWHGQWLMISHDKSEPLSNRVVARVACSPQGSYGSATELFRTPETGKLGSYGRDDVWTYNAHEHPERRQGDRLLVSYNVNSLTPEALYDDTSVYRPRFVWVTIAPK